MLILNLFLGFLMGAQALDVNELNQWREVREEKLKAEDGWLSVVGLEWLKPGENSVGAAFGSDVRLPSGGPKSLGTLTLKGEKIRITFDEITGVKIDGVSVVKGTPYELTTDEDEDFTTVSYGDVKFFMIKRKNGIGVRIKDNKAKARTNFKGLSWYPAKEDMVIQAKWHPYDQPKTLKVPDILGNVNDEEALGYVEFQLAGSTHKLFPSGGPDSLFFVFKDSTNGEETYKASRFLYAEGPRDGVVSLDFNKAYNPPCAFTNYATCPRAPEENILKVAIRAGEKKPH